MPHDVEKIGGILAVVDGELRIEPDGGRIVAQQPRADAVERAGPVEGAGERAGRGAQHLAGDAPDAPRHLGGGAARERHQEDAARVGAADDEMRHAMRQRAGLARAGAGNDQKRPGAMRDGAALRFVEAVEISGHGRINPEGEREVGPIDALFARHDSAPIGHAASGCGMGGAASRLRLAGMV